MKKNLMVLFILAILLFGMGKVNAEIADVTAPVINSITLSGTSFTAGENINIVVDASDDISGIKFLSIEFMKIGVHSEAEDPKGYFYLHFNGEKYNGVHTYTVNIPSYVEPGEYRFYTASLNDNAGNEQLYWDVDGTGDFIKENFNIPNIIITGSESDIKGPILTSLTFDKNNISLNESILVTATVTDESDIYAVFVSFNNTSFLLQKSEGNKYTANITFKVPGEFKFTQMQLEDEYRNASYYYYTNSSTPENGWNVHHYSTLEAGKYDVVVEGTPDKEKPVLKNIIIPNKKVKVPASFNVYVEASDNMDNELDIQLGFGKRDGSYSGENETIYVGKEGDKYVFQVVLGQYEDPGKYVAVQAILIDDSGNRAEYSIEESPYYDYLIMDEYSFEVVKDTDVDITTSTNSKDFINILKNADKNSTITIDTTKNTKISKEVFKLIKEKNIKVNFETKGVQWFFEGKKIKNPKDIDVSVNIDFVDNYKNVGNWNKKKHKALVIEFKDNGKLPGRALVRIKADYAFRNYIGIKNLNLFYKDGNKFDLISKGINLTKDNYYEFYIDHNSVYFLSDDMVEDKYIGDNQSASLGNDDLNKENINNDNISDNIKDEINNNTNNNNSNNNTNNNTNNNSVNEDSKLEEDNSEINNDNINDEANIDNDLEDVIDEEEDSVSKEVTDKLDNDIFVIVIIVCLAIVVGIVVFLKF